MNQPWSIWGAAINPSDSATRPHPHKISVDASRQTFAGKRVRLINTAVYQENAMKRLSPYGPEKSTAISRSFGWPNQFWFDRVLIIRARIIKWSQTGWQAP